MKKRLLSMLLALAMVLSLLPTMVLAADAPVVTYNTDQTVTAEKIGVMTESGYEVYLASLPYGAAFAGINGTAMYWYGKDGMSMSAPVEAKYYSNTEFTTAFTSQLGVTFDDSKSLPTENVKGFAICDSDSATYMRYIIVQMPIAEPGITVNVTVSSKGVIATGSDATLMANVPIKIVTSENTVTVDTVLQKLHELYCADGYAATSFVSKLWGDTSGSFLFFVNGEGLPNGVKTDTVSDGDSLVVAVMKDGVYWADWYSAFDKSAVHVAADEAFTLTLSGHLGMAGTPEEKTDAPIENISVGTVSAGSFAAITDKKTSADGSVTLSFPADGTYVVSADGTVSDIVTAYSLINLGGSPAVYGTMDYQTYDSFVAYTDTDHGNGPYPASEIKYVDFFEWDDDQTSYNALHSNTVIVNAPTVAPVCIVTVAGFVGEGTEASPWLLRNASDLTRLSSMTAAGESFAGKYFKFAGDITLPAGWTPIGTAAKRFSGSIDGDGKLLTVPEGEKALIGCPKEATLKNLNIYGKQINGNGVVDLYTTGVKGYTAITIENVTLKSGTQTLGSGFISGYAPGDYPAVIRNCTVEMGVTIGDGTQSNIGSFGGDFNGTIVGCVSRATVKGVDYVGGICGSKGQTMGNYIIVDCIFAGEVIASGDNAGGISGGGYAGTSLGLDSAPNTPCAVIMNCLCTGSISGANNVGGILGAEPGIKECWNNGVGYIQNNLFTGSLTAAGANKGGIIGYMNCLNNMNVISGNFYLNTSAEKGIGAAGMVETPETAGPMSTGAWASNYSGKKYGRTDDPMGAGADALTKSCTVLELTNGTVLAALNSGTNSSRNWVAGTNCPTFTAYGAKHLIRISNTALSTMNGITTNNGVDNILNGKSLTLHYSDGSTGTVLATDPSVTRLYSVTDSAQGRYLPAAIEYDGHQLVFNLCVKSATAPARKGSVAAKIDDTAVEGKPYTVNLDAAFEDADGEALTYTVKINKKSYVTAETANGVYTYTPTTAGATTLTFKATDGTQTSSDTYIINLTATGNAGVDSLIVAGATAAGTETNYAVTVPYGTTVTAESFEITPTGTGATVSTPETADEGKTWTFSVTASDSVKSTFTVTVSVAPYVPPTASGKITVYFTLLGDKVHNSDSDGEAHTLKAGGLETWIARTSFAVEDGTKVKTVLDMALAANGMRCDNPSGNYVKSITLGTLTLSEFTNGKNSGWMYTLNDTHPGLGVDEQTLADGDVIVFHYTDNYTTEEGSEAWKPATPDGETVIKPETSVTGGTVNASVTSEQVADAIAAAEKAGGTVITVAPDKTGNADKVNVTIPKTAAEKIVTDTSAALQIETAGGTVSIPNDALASILTQAAGTNIEVKVEQKTADDIKDETIDTADAVIVAVSIDSDSKAVTEFGGKALEIRIPVTDSNHKGGETYKVIIISSDGKTEIADGECVKINGELTVVVKTTHLSTFIVTAHKALSFTDIANHWALSAIQYACGHDLMNGVEDEKFDPDGALSRAMLVTILYRMAGEPAVTAANPFKDVPAGHWYTGAVIWASANNIVSGTSETTFAPGDDITREQMAKMLYAYSQFKKYDVSKTNGLAVFTDMADISAWALKSMKWANAEGLITGSSATTLSPTGSASRAEAATILMRYMENIAK